LPTLDLKAGGDSGVNRGSSEREERRDFVKVRLAVEGHSRSIFSMHL
jgi:hypothetical protein